MSENQTPAVEQEEGAHTHTCDACGKSWSHPGTHESMKAEHDAHKCACGEYQFFTGTPPNKRISLAINRLLGHLATEKKLPPCQEFLSWVPEEDHLELVAALIAVMETVVGNPAGVRAAKALLGMIAVKKLAGTLSDLGIKVIVGEGEPTPENVAAAIKASEETDTPGRVLH